MVSKEMARRIFAREWLLLLGLFLFGLLVVPAILAAWQLGATGMFSGRSSYSGGLGRYYLMLLQALVHGDRTVWLYILGPYLIVQAGRSAGWAIRVLRERPPA